MVKKLGLKTLAAAAVIAGLAMFAQACAPECVDRFDCSSRAKPGESWTCDKGACVQGSADPSDAGS